MRFVKSFLAKSNEPKHILPVLTSVISRKPIVKKAIIEKWLERMKAIFLMTFYYLSAQSILSVAMPENIFIRATKNIYKSGRGSLK